MRYILQPELTSFCNFSCRFCPQAYYKKPTPTGNLFDRPKGYMSNEVFELFLKNAAKYACRVCVGFFGEQMLHPKFEEYISKLGLCKRYPTTLFTNWSMATRQNMKALTTLQDLRISLDASNSETFDLMRPGGRIKDLDGNLADTDRYEATLDKLDYWLSLPLKPPTALIFIESSPNKGDTKKFVDKMLPKLSPRDTLVTKCPVSYGGVTQDALMSNNACRVHTEKRLTVAWDGRCTPCNLDVNIGLYAGNLLEHQDIGKITKGPLYSAALKSIELKQGICTNCFDSNNHTNTTVYRGTKQ